MFIIFIVSVAQAQLYFNLVRVYKELRSLWIKISPRLKGVLFEFA